MFDYIKGKLVKYDQDAIVVETGGIGYMVNPSRGVLNELTSEGEQVKIYLHLDVKEDDLNLYGFSGPREREVFRMMLSVSRLGPKTALTVLSSMEKSEFRRAIMEEELGTLTSIKGIGKKTARRLILELQEKITELEFETVGVDGMANSKVSLAVQALTSDSMGFSVQEAREAISRVRNGGDDLDVEELVQSALKELS
ncbi:Holliday junction branch migration protein RuvA [Candidatus Bipolaricaulota bacterium]|nr:Holliday junction branch migration protein RuvA [Candidatus Bipolaricaulota bacterium]